jgi:hypothetical protein
MVIVSLPYQFRQPLRVPAKAAFSWCTQFESADGRLFSQKTVRSVRWLNPDTAILTDLTFPGGRRRRIRRLVRIDPQRMAWTNTHLDGPFRHSQFWYRIVPDGTSASHLEFDGLKLEFSRQALTPAEIARRARANRDSDAGEWRRRLAPALEAEVASHPRG